MVRATESIRPPNSPRQLLGKGFQINVQSREEREQGKWGGKGGEEKKKKIFSWAKNKPLLYFEKLQYIMLRGVFL